MYNLDAITDINSVYELSNEVFGNFIFVYLAYNLFIGKDQESALGKIIVRTKRTLIIGS